MRIPLARAHAVQLALTAGLLVAASGAGATGANHTRLFSIEGDGPIPVAAGDSTINVNLHTSEPMLLWSALIAIEGLDAGEELRFRGFLIDGQYRIFAPTPLLIGPGSEPFPGLPPRAAKGDPLTTSVHALIAEDLETRLRPPRTTEGVAIELFAALATETTWWGEFVAAQSVAVAQAASEADAQAASLAAAASQAAAAAQAAAVAYAEAAARAEAISVAYAGAIAEANAFAASEAGASAAAQAQAAAQAYAQLNATIAYCIENHVSMAASAAAASSAAGEAGAYAGVSASVSQSKSSITVSVGANAAAGAASSSAATIEAAMSSVSSFSASISASLSAVATAATTAGADATAAAISQALTNASAQALAFAGAFAAAQAEAATLSAAVATASAAALSVASAIATAEAEAFALSYAQAQATVALARKELFHRPVDAEFAVTLVFEADGGTDGFSFTVKDIFESADATAQSLFIGTPPTSALESPIKREDMTIR